ncbi:MAG: PKD domain-containing protein [Phycisphaerae bacterium]|nr:PKD domain-containing protein [Phycisphaerae bacterium]
MAGDTVTFTAAQPPAGVLGYRWDFTGTGQTIGSGQIVQRRVQEPGDINVRLTVFDFDYQFVSMQKTVRVDPISPMVPLDTLAPEVGNVRSMVMDGETAWLLQSDGYVVGVDVSDPRNLVEVGRVRACAVPGMKMDVDVARRRLFVPCSTAGLVAVDVSDAYSPFVDDCSSTFAEDNFVVLDVTSAAHSVFFVGHFMTGGWQIRAVDPDDFSWVGSSGDAPVVDRVPWPTTMVLSGNLGVVGSPDGIYLVDARRGSGKFLHKLDHQQTMMSVWSLTTNGSVLVAIEANDVLNGEPADSVLSAYDIVESQNVVDSRLSFRFHFDDGQPFGSIAFDSRYVYAATATTLDRYAWEGLGSLRWVDQLGAYGMGYRGVSIGEAGADPDGTSEQRIFVSLAGPLLQSAAHAY